MTPVDQRTGSGTLLMDDGLPSARSIAVTYCLESNIVPGGYRSNRGWIEADADVLHEAIVAASVRLKTGSGPLLTIELTHVSDGRGHFRVIR
jgi:hypothetical protein